MNGKIKPIVIFLIIAAVFSIFIFLPNGDGKDENKTDTESLQQEKTEGNEAEQTLSEEEINQAEMRAAKTTVWVNADDKDNIEFITLSGEGKYIINYSSELDPQKHDEIWGNYKLRENGVLKLWIDGKQYNGTVSDSELVLEGKIYQKTDDDLY